MALSLEQAGGKMKETMKTAGTGFMALALRLLTGFFLGLTIAFIGQEIIQYGLVSLLFITAVIMGSFLKISSSWSISKILVFDLICVLVAQVLKMYILLAP